MTTMAGPPWCWAPDVTKRQTVGDLRAIGRQWLKPAKG